MMSYANLLKSISCSGYNRKVIIQTGFRLHSVLGIKQAIPNYRSCTLIVEAKQETSELNAHALN